MVVILTFSLTLIGSVSRVHSFRIYLLISYSVPHHVLGSEDSKAEENSYSSCAQIAHCSVE